MPAKVAWILGVDVLGLGVCRANTVLQAALYKVLVSNLAGVSRVDLRPNLASKTILNGRGLCCSAGCTRNQPDRPTLRPTDRPVRGAEQFRPDCFQVLSFTTHWPWPQMQTEIRTRQHLKRLQGGSRFFNSASYTQRLKMPVKISLAFMIRRNMSAEPPGCED